MEYIKCSGRCVKNGKLKSGKQQYKCKECGEQFVENAKKKYITQKEWNLYQNPLLTEQIRNITNSFNSSTGNIDNKITQNIFK